MKWQTTTDFEKLNYTGKVWIAYKEKVIKSYHDGPFYYDHDTADTHELDDIERVMRRDVKPDYPTEEI